jgi:hypothetical protein
MITNQALIDQPKTGSAQESINKPRRALIGGALAALPALLSSTSRVMAQGAHVAPDDPFIVLLKGIYEPVPAGRGPANNLGLTTVNLSDGSYARTLIYPAFGMPESREQGHAIGIFYVSPLKGLCAYDLPGGAMVMQFTSGGFPMIIPDGRGGQFDEGTFELTILEATGVYSAFKGGHNHMVDRLHQLVAGPPFAGFPSSGYDEFCFCIISQYPFP